MKDGYQYLRSVSGKNGVKIYIKGSLAEDALVVKRFQSYDDLIRTLLLEKIILPRKSLLKDDAIPFNAKEFEIGFAYLKHRIDTLPPFEVNNNEVMIQIFYDILAQAKIMEQRGYYHHDIKPGNIMVHQSNGKWRGVLIDLELTSCFNRKKVAIGTPWFFPPEALCSFLRNHESLSNGVPLETAVMEHVDSFSTAMTFVCTRLGIRSPFGSFSEIIQGISERLHAQAFFNAYRRRVADFEGKQWKRDFVTKIGYAANADLRLHELLTKMLAFVPSERMGLDEALKHPVFANVIRDHELDQSLEEFLTPLQVDRGEPFDNLELLWRLADVATSRQVRLSTLLLSLQNARWESDPARAIMAVYFSENVTGEVMTKLSDYEKFSRRLPEELDALVVQMIEDGYTDRMLGFYHWIHLNTLGSKSLSRLSSDDLARIPGVDSCASIRNVFSTIDTFSASPEEQKYIKVCFLALNCLLTLPLYNPSLEEAKRLVRLESDLDLTASIPHPQILVIFTNGLYAENRIIL